MVSENHLNEGAQAFLSSAGDRELVIASSFLKFCRVAEEQVDIYPRLGLNIEWDTPAAHAVLSAVRGKATPMGRACLLYGKGNVLNPHLIAEGGSL